MLWSAPQEEWALFAKRVKVKGGNRKSRFVKNFLEEFLDSIALFLCFLACVIFGHFVELFGQIALPVAVQLRFKAVFAKMMNDVFFA